MNYSIKAALITVIFAVVMIPTSLIMLKKAKQKVKMEMKREYVDSIKLKVNE